jgi:hypothetical protein
MYGRKVSSQRRLIVLSGVRERAFEPAEFYKFYSLH